MAASFAGAPSAHGIAVFLAAVRADEELARALRFASALPAEPPGRVALDALPEPSREVARTRGITALYPHQARALAELRAGRDVVLATPTASGKSLVYALPALEAALADPHSHALFLFPLKALEQDQAKKLAADAEALGLAAERTVAVYDGDTKPGQRTKIRNNPPNVIVTTPDMLHLGLLPHHMSWERFFRGLSLVVVDELHAYRGIFGSHVAQVLRRLDRVAAFHGARPRFVCASATVANPGELAQLVTGRAPVVVHAEGAPRSKRDVLFLNPVGTSPYTAAARLFRIALKCGLRTIAFTKARRVTELMHQWIAAAEPQLAPRISSYRAGFLPEERREIEQRLFTGELAGVISTSALELGIDVGGLDVCILVGYPGSQIATWQRAGRVGRAGDAAIALVAQPDALDQYMVAHPEQLLGGAFEHAVLDPLNADLLAAHLPCAAAEVPLRDAEPWLAEPAVRAAASAAEQAGELLRSESGREWFAARRNPHRLLSLRATGASYAIQLAGSGGLERSAKVDDDFLSERAPARRKVRVQKPKIIGSIGAGSVMSECHPGAIYLHHGRQFKVVSLDLELRKVEVEHVEVAYFTKPLGERETEVLSRTRQRPAGSFLLAEGRVKVTSRIVGYERRRVRGQELLGTEALDLPPSQYETNALWLELPDEISAALAANGRNPMGSLHAVEHASLALLPLFALCDRFDLAGITYKLHPQLGRAAIFLYDAAEGGVGLVRSVYDKLETLLETTLARLRECECEAGCPACVHSPRCSNGNRPIDKAGAQEALAMMLGREILPPAPAPLRLEAVVTEEEAIAEIQQPELRVVSFDLETQRSADEVGGWHNAHLMRLACAVAWDSAEQEFFTYREHQVDALLEKLGQADLVIGFNAHRFDYRVLRGYAARDLSLLPTFDLLDAIHERLGFRLPLGHLGEETLGVPKSADGLQSLQWFKEGRHDEIARYCQQDVAILRDLFAFACRHGHLLFRAKNGERVRLPLKLSAPELVDRERKREARRRMH
ncbi:MAG: DEAD/DEAH box helicase [Deltaproteobacteria bacterium]|nr:DEAD/DEAH box helicase [Deltaproteobacteria bacterium]